MGKKSSGGLGSLGVLVGVFGIVAGSVIGVQHLTSDPDVAYNQLETQGYTDIEVGGPSITKCGFIFNENGNYDFFSNKFTATNPDGEEVSGVVCRGFFKNPVIRLDR